MVVIATGTAPIASAAGIVGDPVIYGPGGHGSKVNALSPKRLCEHPSIKTDGTDQETTAAAVGEAVNTRRLNPMNIALVVGIVRDQPRSWRCLALSGQH